MLIAGVDEAGRGPLAGPVVAAAVILHPDKPILGLADSKELTAKKREHLFDIICENALAFSLGRAEPAEIDKLNILQATLLAMKRAVEGLKIAPEAVWIDGNHCPSTAYPMKAIIGGDRLVSAISAASILAKVTRDREMRAMDALYPKYGFVQHKGYPTALHRDKLKKYGPSPIHRLSFGPVAALLSGTAHE